MLKPLYALHNKPNFPESALRNSTYTRSASASSTRKSTMPGRSANELSPETQQAGDTLEYYCRAFVAGDPNGHRYGNPLKLEVTKRRKIRTYQLEAGLFCSSVALQ